jgi:hypothetical protein
MGWLFMLLMRRAWLMPQREKGLLGVESSEETLRWLVVRADVPGRRPPSISRMESYEESEASQYEQPRWDFWLYGAGFVTAVLVVASLLSPWVRHEWALSLGRQNTPYTQLGFNRAAALPFTAVRGKSIPISFTITNNEGKQILYQYVVASGSGIKLKSLSSATKVVAMGASWDVDITVVPKCAESVCRIQVSLPRQGESIDFIFTYPDKSSRNK